MLTSCFLSVQEPHRHKGIFVARGGKEDLLATGNFAPGISVYGEKRITVENTTKNEDGTPAGKVEYRIWNPFRSKLAAGILGGVDNLFIKPGSKVLCTYTRGADWLACFASFC